MSFSDLKNAKVRLMLLQLLVKAPGYKAEEGELVDMLRMFGHELSRDFVRTQIAWLVEQGLVKAKMVNEIVQVVTLTNRGEDAAYGRAITPGVKRPGPEDSL